MPCRIGTQRHDVEEGRPYTRPRRTRACICADILDTANVCLITLPMHRCAPSCNTPFMCGARSNQTKALIDWECTKLHHSTTHRRADSWFIQWACPTALNRHRLLSAGWQEGVPSSMCSFFPEGNIWKCSQH